ncbi:MAG: HTH domain-containing protein [Lactobacillus johnsonii]|nr:HTH domain-containing protein [Lactobacillus johnsonii]
MADKQNNIFFQFNEQEMLNLQDPNKYNLNFRQAILYKILAVTYKASRDRQGTYISNQRIAKLLTVTTRTVSDDIKQLSDLGLISITNNTKQHKRYIKVHTSKDLKKYSIDSMVKGIIEILKKHVKDSYSDDYISFAENERLKQQIKMAIEQDGTSNKLASYIHKHHDDFLDEDSICCWFDEHYPLAEDDDLPF